MNRPEFTPLHLMLLLHYHVTSDPWPQAGAPAVLKFTDSLAVLGLIEWDERLGRYSTTDKGVAHIQALRTAPLPERRWVIPAQDERGL
jgi:hypothetical protein